MTARGYLDGVIRIAYAVSDYMCEDLVKHVERVRHHKGRLFLVGLGGSLGNCSHAVNDFRKLANVNAACPENLSELTARANDEGWNTMYSEWLKTYAPGPDDALMVLSVGGGTATVSQPLVNVIDTAKEFGMTVLGIVGRDGGYTKQRGDCVLVIPPSFPERVTPYTESFQSVILHYIVSALAVKKTKW